MPAIKLRYVKAYRDRHGRWRYYYRRRGIEQMPLPGDPSRPEFHIELARLNALKATGESLPVDGSFAHLVALYLASPSFTKLAIKTQRDYRYWLEKLRMEFGDLPVTGLTRAAVFALRDRMAATPRKANYVVAVLRRVLGQAVNRDWIPVNPAAKPELITTPPRRQLWSAEAQARFLAAAPEQLRLAYMLGAYTAQREGDILRMAWSQVQPDRILLRQAKTGALLEVPIHHELQRALDAASRRSPLILTTKTGRAWSEHHFRHAWKAAMDAAGVTGLQFRDLRRTAMVRLAEAGATVPEIAAVSGHTIETTTQILETYLPRNFTMARAAIVKLEKRTRERRKGNT